MKLYFARHGESEANTLGVISNRGLMYSLTDTGRQQAAALAARVKDIRFARIYSSPLSRAIQTAEILARELAPFALPGTQSGGGDEGFEITDALREYDCGILARFVPFIERITHEHGEADNILLVSHGGVLLAALPILLTNIDHTFASGHIHFCNTDIVIAETRPEGLVCLTWCDIVPAEPSTRFRFSL